MDKKRITTLSLLAHINNSTTGINDLSEIFVPLVKRVISQMNSEALNRGASVDEIKTKVDNVYKLDMPFPLLKKIVRKIATDENIKGEKNFEYFHDGSYIIKSFVFADYEEVIQDQELEVDFIQESYESYLEVNKIDKKTQPSIFEFLDSNRITLSQYFANKTPLNPTIEFVHQANFVNSVKKIPRIYGVLRKIYLGSIISSYLEVDYGNIKKDVEFLVDTNFIVGLLDLNSIEAKHTCRKIVEICNRLGYKLSVMDFTLEETEALLQRTAESYESTFLAKKIDPESIYCACDRRQLSKTDLQIISTSFTKSLFNDFKINLIGNTTKLRNEAKFSLAYKRFKEIRPTEFSALHDATAVTYVQQKRSKRITNIEDSNCWFVTNVSHDISFFKDNSYLPEIIRAEDLVNLLWLTNPLVKTDETVEIGLTRMVSCAVGNSLPSARVIKELDENIQKYAQNNIDPRDIVRVANKIANKTITNLDQLNQTAKEDPTEFVKKLQRIADKDRDVESRREAEIKELLLNIQEEAEQKLKDTIDDLKESHKHNIESIKDVLQNEFYKKYSEQEITGKNNQLSELERAFEPLRKTKLSYDKNAGRKAHYVLFSIISIPIIALIVIMFRVGWKKFEPWTLPITLFPLFLSYIYFAIRNKEMSFRVIWDDIKEGFKNRYYKKFSFDLGNYKNTEERINNLKAEINNLPNS